MSLVGNISGSSTHNSRIGITGSVVFAGADPDLVVIFPNLGTDTAFYVSGTINGKDHSTDQCVSVFGGDVVISGSLGARQKYIYTHKYDSAGTGQAYVRFNAAGQNSTPGVNNKFLVPYSGRLIKVIARSTAAAGSTVIAFHKSSDGTSNLNTSATATVTVTMSSANTAYEFEFTAAAAFDEGDIVGLSLDPTDNPNDVDLSSVWEFETYETY